MSKQAKIGVVGWLFHWDNEYAVTTAACDVNEAKLAQFKAEHPEVETYTDYKQMATEAGLDAVVISTPNWLHREMAEFCMRAGLDVFLEKPMGVNKQEIDSVVRVQQETGKICAIDFELRVSPSFARIRELIAAGEIGEPRGIEFVHHRGGWIARGNCAWRTDPTISGGLFFMEICHEVDIYRQLMGEITHVQSFSHPNLLPQYRGMPDNVVTHLWFEGGRRGTILASHTSSTWNPGGIETYADLGHDMYMIITGSEGALRIECIRDKILVMRYGEYHPDLPMGKRVEFVRLEDYSTVPAFAHDITANHMAFLKAVATGTPHHHSTEDAWRTHVACLAAEQSALEDSPKMEIDYSLGE